MSTTFGRLVKTDLKLMTRDPLVLTFVFVFPVVTMLIIGGAFGTAPNPGFDHTNPARWYVALPTLSRSLRASEADLQWFSSGYLLVLAAAMLPAGLLGDRYGRKAVLLVALGLFGVGSAARAYSTSAGEFLGARVLVGLARGQAGARIPAGTPAALVPRLAHLIHDMFAAPTSQPYTRPWPSRWPLCSPGRWAVCRCAAPPHRPPGGGVSAGPVTTAGREPGRRTWTVPATERSPG